MSEEDGARLFASLRTVDVPASGGVSVERAIRTGKRTKALRVTAAGVFVLIAMGVLPLVLRPSAAPPVAAGTFDPLVRTVNVGAVAGFRPLTYITGRESQMILMSPDSKGYESAHAVVYAPGVQAAPSGEPIPDVNGRRALWTGTNVAVEWTSGGWAFVQVQGFPDDRHRDRDRARLLAESLRFDEHRQLEFPFTVQTTWELDGARDTEGYVELVFTNGVRLGKSGVDGPGQRQVPPAELEAVEQSMRPADPPVTNPFR